MAFRKRKIGSVKKLYFRDYLKYKNPAKGPVKWNKRVFSTLFSKQLLVVMFLGSITLIGFSFYGQIAPYFNDFSLNTAFAGQTKLDITPDINASVLGASTEATQDVPTGERKTLTEDTRAYVFEEYFRQRSSPLQGQGQTFVDACEKYGMVRDCIGMVAVAQHETLLCNYYNSASYFNCWGFGGAGADRWRFTSFETSIDVTTQTTMRYYGNPFFTDFTNGDEYFCGPQDECIGWGQRVNWIADQIDVFAEQLGVGRLTTLRE